MQAKLAGMRNDVKPASRRDRAAATRRAIIEAATLELTESGYQATTMAAIARRAGVATQTVYFVFHTKATLLMAAIEAAVLARGAPPQLTAWWAEATAGADGSRAVEAFVYGSVDILERAAPLVHVGRSAAATDPDLQDALARNERLREAGYLEFVETLKARRLLREGVTIADATETLLTLVGPAVFVEVTRERGWDVRRYAGWATEALTQLLVGGK